MRSPIFRCRLSLVRFFLQTLNRVVIYLFKKGPNGPLYIYKAIQSATLRDTLARFDSVPSATPLRQTS